MTNKSWNNWRFKIHWNYLEWVNPRYCSTEKVFLFYFSNKFYLKDNDKTSHSVGHSKLKFLYLKDLY